MPHDFPGESKEEKKERARAIYDRLTDEYPDPETALDYADPFQLAVATILSAQSTDEQVNRITPELFRRFPDAESLARADREEVEEIVHSTGFFRNKAKNIIGMARGLVEEHGGEVPRSLSELTDLPGIGRKTANVILGNAFGVDEGVVVDTHVRRLSRRLGFTEEERPEKIEEDLMDLFPKKTWTPLSHLLIFHGRQVCKARKPQCRECLVAALCPFPG